MYQRASEVFLRYIPYLLRMSSIAVLACVPLHAESLALRAITTDPPRDRAHPARLVEMQVPSHGAAMNAVFYLASGAAPHPVVLLLHGFPGNEQNLDLAQAMRRAGWSVLTIHYRGSWGSPGAFSFTHAAEDTEAALAFLHSPDVAAKFDLDPKRIVVIGHSMGGFLAIHTARTHPELSGVVVISGWNIGADILGAADGEAKQQALRGFREEMPPLAGCTPDSLYADARAHGASWDFTTFQPAARTLPVLVIEAADGNGTTDRALAATLRREGDAHVTERSMDTDHSYSDHRIALEEAVVTWLLARKF